MLKTREWFDEWFDSPYYHVLYWHRNEQEARSFIDQLIKYFEFSENNLILDLACGKGRHAIYLNKKGFNIIGLDLSVHNIDLARKYENNRLKFYVHDMRYPWTGEKFNHILNLFTSFGYFETKGENQQAITAIAKGMKKGGKLLIDFLNPYTVINNLVPEEVKCINGISFYIRKYLEGEYIVKDIMFEDDRRNYHFQERVKAIRRVKFMEYFRIAGLELVDLFGDYNLNSYIAQKSDRMIFVLRK